MSATETLANPYHTASTAELEAKIRQAKEQLGTDLLILAHHYQKDEIIPFADEVGDSLQLAQIAAKNKAAKHIVFCGVHFMAETADMLTEDYQNVYLPDPLAGCSMADMANGQQLQTAWQQLTELFGDTILPVTYINSTAEVKAFVGVHGGATVTSSNAEEIVRWALSEKERLFFLPDQHLGRNTAYHLGIPLSEMAVWNPFKGELLYEGELEQIKVILWDGYCSVHQQFTAEQIQELRATDPDVKVIVHPECPHEVVELADVYGSTNKILKDVQDSPVGTKWAIGTDNNLVGRMIAEITDKDLRYLNPAAAPCLTMNRIRLAHLAQSLDAILEGAPQNQITVDAETTQAAVQALDRMLIRS